jgi:hypothetical protein
MPGTLGARSTMSNRKCLWTLLVIIILLAAPGLTWAQGVCPLNGTGEPQADLYAAASAGFVRL